MRGRDLLPWRDITIDTSWPPAVVHTELAKQMDPPRLRGDSGDGPFIGEALSQGHFRFRRHIGYRKALRPTLVAIVEPAAHGGSRIRVHMRLHPMTAILLSLWLALATFIGVPLGVQTAVVGLLMLVFGAAITCIPFALEARSSERMLREIFAKAPARPEPAPPV